jgi:hypothetical protein
MGTEIKEVASGKDLRDFIRLPWRIYQGDPYWVPPLLLDMRTILSKKKNPFFRHSEADMFLAVKDGEVVGRIAAILNNNHNSFHQEKTGFFGFFESIADQEVADTLFSTAKSWVKARGMTHFRGPVNFSTNDSCGLLYHGFDSSPVILMTYNPRYYLELFDRAGLKVTKLLYAYRMTKTSPMPERFVQFAKKALQDPSIRIRSLNMKNFPDEVKTIGSIYEDAWEKNWGFVPMTPEELAHLAKDLKAGVDPDLVHIAEVDGETAGFSLVLPDFNEILKHVNGRLFPFGIFKLLMNKNKIKGVRVIGLGVRQKFQKKRSLAPGFYYKTYKTGIEKGYSVGEFSWILEDNVLMNRAIEGMGAKLYKKYAIYEQQL